MMVLADPPVVPIEGKLLVGGYKPGYFLEGSSDNGYPLIPSFPGEAIDVAFCGRGIGGEQYQH